MEKRDFDLMKNHIIFLSLLLYFVSCGSRGGSNEDSTYAIDSIHIDEGTLLSSDTISVDTTDKIPPYVSFSSVKELKAYLNESPDRNAYSEGIISLIADSSLEYAEKLVNNTHDGFIVVDKGRMKVIYFDKYGREKLSYGMACAKRFGTKHKKADSRTPEGFFSAAGVYDSTEWLFTDDDGKTSDKKGQFGPRFIRLKIPNTSQIGIHGTCSPWTIGHRSSHGCIRVTNENIMELVKYVTVGMPIIVVPGKRDMEINKAEESETVWIPTSFSSKEPKLRELDEATIDLNNGIKPEDKIQKDTIKEKEKVIPGDIKSEDNNEDNKEKEEKKEENSLSENSVPEVSTEQE